MSDIFIFIASDLSVSVDPICEHYSKKKKAGGGGQNVDPPWAKRKDKVV